MKKLFFLLLGLINLSVVAQLMFTGFNYKALLTDQNGIPRANEQVNVRVSIYEEMDDLVYQETFTTFTDQNGIVKFDIGDRNSAVFDTISWHHAPYYSYKIEFKLSGDNDYVEYSHDVFQGVPYSAFARYASEVPYNGIMGKPAGLLDKDFMKVGSSQPPTNYNDDMWTEGRIGVNTHQPNSTLELHPGLNRDSTVIHIDGPNRFSENKSIDISITSVDSAKTAYGLYSYLSGQGTLYGAKNHFSNYNYSGNRYGFANKFSGSEGTNIGFYNSFNTHGGASDFGILNNMYTSGSGPQIGLVNSLERDYNATQGVTMGIHNEILNGSSDPTFGLYNKVKGKGLVTANYNEIDYQGNELHIGVKNMITNGDNEMGVYNIVSPEQGHSGVLFGLKNWMEGHGYISGVSNIINVDGPGDVYAALDSISGTGDSRIYGQYTRINNSGSGNHYGQFIILDGAGTGLQTGSEVMINNSSDIIQTGYQAILGDGGGVHYAYRANLNGNGNGEQYGQYVVINNSGSGDHFGTYNKLSGSGTGMQYGTKNEIDNPNNMFHIGTQNLLKGSGSGIHIGTHNKLQGNGTGMQVVTLNEIDSPSDYTLEGTYTHIRGQGSGWKYGTYILIDSTSGGTHYGVYVDVRKAGSYAGYFNGNVEVTKKLKSPVSGDADMKAYMYGFILGSGTKISNGSTDGFSVQKLGTGRYKVIFDNSMPSYNSYIVTVTKTNSNSPSVISVDQWSGFFYVYIYDLQGQAKDDAFTFVLFKK